MQRNKTERALRATQEFLKIAEGSPQFFMDRSASAAKKAVRIM
jgi:hypothetical protein